MCDYVLCNIRNSKRNITQYTCVWCNRNFHKQCLFKDRLNPNVLFEHNNNIQCSFCDPKLPLQVYETNSNDIITINSYGTYVDEDLETKKYKSETNFVYPIGYTCTRRLPSYKNQYSHVDVKCEIHTVDEKYLEGTGPGNKDVYLFRVIYQDDQDNPIEVLGSLRYLAAKINEKYTSKKITVNGLKFFGLDIDYVQYLISTHVPDADEFGYSRDMLLQKICDDGKLDKCTIDLVNKYTDENTYIYGVNRQLTTVSLDPQKQLFNI